ncbi:MAG TPA: hypothetical protein PKL71_06875, partial [Marmoricola sp.]|nr:hypothetical protein [Marmoricola sp.]
MNRDQPDPERSINQVWQEIIDNYGERVEITQPPVQPRTADSEPHSPEPIVETDPLGEVFIPPRPGPQALPEPRRRIAWFGVFGVPLLLLVSLLASVQLPDWAIGI